VKVTVPRLLASRRSASVSSRARGDAGKFETEMCHNRCARSTLNTLIALALLCAGVVMAEPAGDPLFPAAREAFQQRHFDRAADLLERIIEREPKSARYHYWLGKAYGREAEHANWLRAVLLAKKARAAFERAVALDPDYVPALEALIEYYRSAPAFLGGSAEKAATYERRLSRLSSSGTAE